MENITDYENRILAIEKDMADIRNIQNEIKTMNSSLIVLTTELKNTNSHLARHEKKLDELDREPKETLKHIKNMLITASITGIVGVILGIIFSYRGG